MTQANAVQTTVGNDRSRRARKVLAVELLRELAAILQSQAESMEQSPICSADWLIVQLIGAQSVSASWQARVSAHVRAWEIEDYELRQPLPADV